MAVKTYPKKCQTKVSKYFSAWEFDCPCDEEHPTLIDDRLLPPLDGTRENIGVPCRLTSAHRCDNYQLTLKLRGYETAEHSQHPLGGAADIQPIGVEIPGTQIEQAMRKAGFRAVGVGHNWCHGDIRADKDRRWEYKSR